MTPVQLRQKRRSLGLTQAELAKRLGIGKLFIFYRESGEREIPRWLSIAVTCLADHLR